MAQFRIDHKVPAQRHKFVNILLVYNLIALSTIPLFKDSFGRAIMLICIIYLYRHVVKIFNKETIIIIAIVFMLELYHAFYFSNYDTWVVRQVVTFFLLGTFTANYLKLEFIYIYIKIMYIITIISFIFFLGLIINPALIHFIDESLPNIFKIQYNYYGSIGVQTNPIIYNFDHNFYKIRNNGPFWEPTVFASLLLIGQVFNLLINRKLFNKYGIIFTLGIISTFSTTVYLSYFIFLICYCFLSNKINIIFKGIIAVFIVFGSLFLFYNLPFLHEKISTEITGVDENIEGNGDSRVAGATLDLIEISQNSLFIYFGKGSDKDSRIAGLDKKVQRNCGLTALLIEWGIFFALTYIFLLYYSFHQLCRVYKLNSLFAIPFTLCMLIVCFSEVFLDLPLFHTFIFFGFVVKRYYPQDMNISKKLFVKEIRYSILAK
jgi:hypothetical protein